MKKLLLAASKQDKSPTEIIIEYNDFTHFFSLDLAIRSLNRTGINKHAIKVLEGKSPLYSLIYSQNLVELETFKTYIVTQLKIRFIYTSKSLGAMPLIFDKKSDRNFHLYINY